MSVVSSFSSFLKSRFRSLRRPMQYLTSLTSGTVASPTLAGTGKMVELAYKRRELALTRVPSPTRVPDQLL
jgi:hypothetical protein